MKKYITEMDVAKRPYTFKEFTELGYNPANFKDYKDKYSYFQKLEKECLLEAGMRPGTIEEMREELHTEAMYKQAMKLFPKTEQDED